MTISEAKRPWWILIGCCAGLFVLMLDSTVVNLALPRIQHDLGASTSELQWVMNAYLLVLAALTVTLGRLGDILGRRRIFLAGMAVFVIGSVVSALSNSPLELIVGRILQGVGASGLLPLSLALVADAFPDDQRPRALGIWAAVSAIALAIGPIVGGFFVDDISWRWIFWINLPICAIGTLITLAAARESRDETSEKRIDVPGLLTLGGGLAGVVLALVQGRQWGWDSAATLGCLSLGFALLVAFCLIEQRVREPIVDFALFHNGPYFGATAAAFALVGAWWGVIFYMPQYLQTILGHSALVAGLLTLPITAPMVVLSPFTARLMKLVGVRTLMTLGMACGTLGVLLLTRIDADSGYATLLPGFLLFGIALGLVYASMSTAAMEAMPREKAGIASGVLAMNRVMAGALVLAVLGALFQALQQQELSRIAGLTGAERADLDGLLSGSDAATAALAEQPPSVVATIQDAAAEAFAFALSNSLWVLVALLALGTILTAIFVRATGDATPDPSVAHHHRHHHFHLH